MTIQMRASLIHVVTVFLLSFLLGGTVFAQQTTFVAYNADLLESTTVTNTPAPQATDRHRFWDTKNRILFTAVAAFSAADFAVTKANLQNGGRELNPVTRMFGTSSAGLAVNFAGEAVGVVGLSYFFHKTGHHKLERAVSMVNIGSSATALGFDLAHR